MQRIETVTYNTGCQHLCIYIAIPCTTYMYIHNKTPYLVTSQLSVKRANDKALAFPDHLRGRFRDTSISR